MACCSGRFTKEVMALYTGKTHQLKGRRQETNSNSFNWSKTTINCVKKFTDKLLKLIITIKVKYNHIGEMTLKNLTEKYKTFTI